MVFSVASHGPERLYNKAFRIIARPECRSYPRLVVGVQPGKGVFDKKMRGDVVCARVEVKIAAVLGVTQKNEHLLVNIIELQMVRIGHVQHAYSVGNGVHDVLHALCRRFQKRGLLLLLQIGLGDVGLDDEHGVGVIQIIVLYFAADYLLRTAVRVTAQAHLKMAVSVQVLPHHGHWAVFKIALPVLHIYPGGSSEFPDFVKIELNAGLPQGLAVAL